MSVVDEIAATRVDALDRTHRTSWINARIDSRAKDRARSSFAAYEAAVRSGDTEGAAAARERFLAASAELRRSR